MAKKNQKKEEPAKPPPKIKYEESSRFKAIERMMRTNKGVIVE